MCACVYASHWRKRRFTQPSILHVLKTSAANCYTYPTLINLILIFSIRFFHLRALSPAPTPVCECALVCATGVCSVPVVDDLTGTRCSSLTVIVGMHWWKKGVRNRKVRQGRHENIKKKIIHTIKYCTKCIIICLSLK